MLNLDPMMARVGDTVKVDSLGFESVFVVDKVTEWGVHNDDGTQGKGSKHGQYTIIKHAEGYKEE